MLTRKTKRCPSCEERGREPVRPLDDFNVDRYRRDGLTRKCWECNAEDFHRRYWSNTEFRERTKERNRNAQRKRRAVQHA